MISRRSFIRSAAGAAGVGAGLGAYTWLIEPHWLEIVRRPLPISRLPQPLQARAKSVSADLVTDADGKAEAAAVEILARERPDDAIQGEEGADHTGTGDRRWWIDGIDGTVAFASRLNGWCSAVALEDEAQVMSNTALEERITGQPPEVEAEVLAINEDARNLSLQVALSVPLLAGLAGLVNSFRMMRLPDPAPSSAAELAALG